MTIGRYFTKIIAVSFAVSCIFSSMALAQESPSYDITATIDVKNKTLLARQKVSFTNNTSQPTREIYFHIYPNRLYTPQEKSFLLRYASYFKVDPFPDRFPSNVMSIHSVASAGENLQYIIEGEDQTILKVLLPVELKPAQQTSIELDFLINIPHAYGRFGWHEQVIALSRWYPILSVYDENGWHNHPYYPFHRPFFSEAAHYRVRLTVAKDQTVIHTGNVQSEQDHANNTKTLELKTELPVREFTMALSAQYRWLEGKSGHTTIKSYYLPGREDRAREAIENAQGLMAFYAQKFGEYPYPTFAIAPVYLGYGGEQMSNVIFIDTRVFDLPGYLPRYFDFLIAHETGHQWFYNVLGIDSFNHIWMEEGFNSYFLLEYLEHKYGKNAGIVDFSNLPDWMEMFIPHLSFRQTRDVRYKIMSRGGLDHPIIDKLSGYSEPSSIFSLAYGKGSMVVGMLKELVGDEIFQKIFIRVFKEYAFKNISLDDFIRVAQEESQMDLTSFFADWLFSIKKFDVAIRSVKGQNILLENRGDIAMPVDVSVVFADGTKRVIPWLVGAQEELLTVESDSPITQVVLDPQEKWLDIDRTNNVWPRQIRLRPVAFYFPLYDVSVFHPEDSYNVVFGPELNQGIGVKASIQKPYDQIAYAATDYDINNRWHTSRVGYQLNNVFQSLTTMGIEMKNRSDYDDGQEDLVTGKLFLRRELWPVEYGLLDVNDHVSLYLIRNQSLQTTKLFGGKEDIRNVSYLKNDEAIVGTALHLGRGRPYPDPEQGYVIDALLENSGHFLGATQQFTRTMVDYRIFQPVTRQSRLGFRLKHGWGSVDDKNLFELGGVDGLRGFDRKTVRGSNALLGSAEYRFPLLKNLDIHVLDRTLGLEKISAVAFFDAGQSWYGSFSDSQLRKNAGLGLRFHMIAGSFLERWIVRVDAAQAIDDDEDDIHYWLGVNHAF